MEIKDGDTVVATYTWAEGRQLVSMTENGAATTYTYDANGMRTGRTYTKGSTTNTYQYFYSGDKLVRLIRNGVTVDFSYNGNVPATMTFNGNTYYYLTNVQGDIIGLTDSTGKIVMGYLYEAYGYPSALNEDPSLSATILYLNPFMYRGYVFDIETKLYYLQSRYYDPEMGRFINADSFVSTGQGLLGNNMFAYCLNNPVVYGDYSGEDAVVLYKSSGVGHIGLLIQDNEGKWWHFYWGADGWGNVALSAIGLDVRVKVWLEEYTGDPASLDEINAAGQYGGTYDNMHYVYGDFSATLDEIKKLDGHYNLYNNNCGQVCMRLMAASDSSYQEVFLEASELWTPFEIDRYLSAYIRSNHPWSGSSQYGSRNVEKICVQ